MKTKAVRLYGTNDLRLEEFDLPEMREDEILAKVCSDTICMSSYKAAIQGKNHKRVPDDVGEHPVIIGHEFCGVIEKVGSKWRRQFKGGDKILMQTALNENGSLAAPGFSFPYVGGDATHILIPNVVMELNCLLPYHSDVFYLGCLAEPVGCIIGAFHASYHTRPGCYEFERGIKKGGKMAILAGTGPMGLGVIDYALHCDRHPSLLVVTDIDKERLRRAASIYTAENAKALGTELFFVDSGAERAQEKMMDLAGGAGFDDIFVMAPVSSVVEQADHMLARDGCLNFFAGPTDPKFEARFNFYNVHYASTHVVGTTGGNTSDMLEAVEMISGGRINPTAMITHVGGLNAVVDTTLNLPHIPGGKKLIYNQIEFPLTALSDFDERGKTDALCRKIGDILRGHHMLWCREAEQALLAQAKSI